MKQLKMWPHIALVALLSAVVSGGIAAFWVRHREQNEAKAFLSAARVARVDGDVGVSRGAAAAPDSRQWLTATTNTPLSVGDRIYARDNAHASVAFTGRNFARLNPRTSLDVMYLTPDRTQLALRDGSAMFDVGALSPGQLFEVATPFGAVDFDQPGLYQVGYNDNGSPYVSVLNGLARVVGLGGTGRIGKGEMLTLLGQTAADVALSRLDPGYAGGLVNDYYSYRYPNIYDGRYNNYDAYLNDPSYYDPYNRFTSYQYVSDVIPGVEDLDAYGDWQDVSGYGHCWRPRVGAGWTPYQEGSWAADDPYGLTWVSSEPWGYAPYHYGRWANVNNQWFWIPEAVNTRPAYAPALVAFLPLTQANEVGWVPLGPGDPYAPAYYDANWQPHYVGSAPAAQQVVNMSVPGAVTVVPVQYINDVINQRVITRVDPQTLAQVRPVFDPFAVNALRQAALQPPKGRRPFDVPPGIARKLEETQVVASAAPPALPFMPNPAQALRVEAIPDRNKREKLQFRDERQQAAQGSNDAGRPAQVQAQGNAAPVNDQAEQQRRQQMAALAAEAQRGNRDARRQLQQLQRQDGEQRRAAIEQQRAALQQQRAMTQQQQAAQSSAPQASNDRGARASEQQNAQGERVAMRQQQQAQREAERQQALSARQQQQQQRAAAQQQVEARRQANSQAAAQRAQQNTQRAQQAAQAQQQMRARAEQQQQVRQQAVQQRQQSIQQGPPARRRAEQPRPQPQAQRPQPQPRPQGPPPQQNDERRQGPPQQAARPQPQPQAARQQQQQPPPSQGHGQGGGKKHP